MAAPPPAPPDLESAVALLDLAGHPHVLGREAFAVFAQAACCAGLALVCRGPESARVVDAQGWTHPDVLARLDAPDAVIPLGSLRDDAWLIVAEPRPDLEARCTFSAIRRLLDTARTLEQYRRDEKQRAALWPAEDFDGEPESLWLSEQSTELVATARRVAASPLPVLLLGETGTGKEMLARLIHRASDRAGRPFLPFNCSAVPRDMLESQLFGYRRGAFTGADTSFPGVIRAATGGTLFLDEIGDVSPEIQTKLLRFLDANEIHPLGEAEPLHVDVRVIAATNAQLDRLVAEGRFRDDLYYRLTGTTLTIPPLRERREEIPALLQHFLRKYGDEFRKAPLAVSDELLEYVVLYAWPGNIRQLAHEVRRLAALAEPGSTLQPSHLSAPILGSRRTIAVDSEHEIRLRLDQALPEAVDALEQAMVRHALRRAKGRVEDASRLLGISRKGLFLKRRRWGLAS